jgi:hypothetical protein
MVEHLDTSSSQASASSELPSSAGEMFASSAEDLSPSEAELSASEELSGGCLLRFDFWFFVEIDGVRSSWYAEVNPMTEW